MNPIEFYFDFSSPYGYLASLQIDVLGRRHGRDVEWRPFLLGAAFKETGQRPLTEQALRGPYHRRDFARSARLLGVPFRLPEAFPFASVAACRAFYWLRDGDPAAARNLAQALYGAAFAEGRPIAAVDDVVAVAAPLGVGGDALRRALDDPAVKARLRRGNRHAHPRCVVGLACIICRR